MSFSVDPFLVGFFPGEFSRLRTLQSSRKIPVVDAHSALNLPRSPVTRNSRQKLLKLFLAAQHRSRVFFRVNQPESYGKWLDEPLFSPMCSWVFLLSASHLWDYFLLFLARARYWKLYGVMYGGFLKWWYPQNTPKWSLLVGKSMLVGYHHFWKPPYGRLGSTGVLWNCGFFWEVQGWQSSPIFWDVHFRFHLSFRGNICFFSFRRVNEHISMPIGGWTNPVEKYANRQNWIISPNFRDD